MTHRPVFVLVAALLLGGCATIEEKAASLQLPAVQSQSNFYARTKPVVFEALVDVLETMGYTISRAQPAQGVIEAYSHLLEGDDPGSSRQFFISARLQEVGETESSVELKVREAFEGNFKAGATRESHAQHGRYDSIFEALEAKLGEGSWLPPSQPSPGSVGAGR
ncbi:hypothetical protein [Actomonas aquatica]|uniref:Lipoprotein n=1 Tax=Actomonas aquatica TaxID=2866162 RepID=A0ABZ1C8E0_9BACT|nr:hypothetical protein [Opitutus sp. WL0086]WRQ87736.1 hypothetical protein K1X11_023235 [Opitutus sp. WL0086]